MTQQEYLKRFAQENEIELALTTAKNGDYAETSDAFKNFRQIEVLTGGVISTEIGMFTRLSDKMSRLGSLLVREAKVKDESIQDTLRDISVYSKIMRIYLENKDATPKSK